mmetsp:Transcript_18859/g.58041  ORF Transcript_18859/g.58041 Transcript_18859/m.58041 type:complete len:246 (-) Transcript_18859:172-909(-)
MSGCCFQSLRRRRRRRRLLDDDLAAAPLLAAVDGDDGRRADLCARGDAPETDGPVLLADGDEVPSVTRESDGADGSDVGVGDRESLGLLRTGTAEDTDVARVVSGHHETLVGRPARRRHVHARIPVAARQRRPTALDGPAVDAGVGGPGGVLELGGQTDVGAGVGVVEEVFGVGGVGLEVAGVGGEVEVRDAGRVLGALGFQFGGVGVVDVDFLIGGPKSELGAVRRHFGAAQPVPRVAALVLDA